MSFPLHRSACTRTPLSRRLQHAYTSGALRLVKRMHALLALAEDLTGCDVAALWALGEQTVRAYRHQFLWKGVASWVDQRPPGRPSTLTTTPRQELARVLTTGPQASGYPSGGWNTPMMQDFLQRRLGVEYPPHSMCPLWQNLGFAYQQARVVADHLHEAKHLAWRQTRWPQMLRQARQRKARRLCGDAASFAQGGALRYTWAPRGQQPEVPPSGKRKAYKVFERIDYCSGRFFFKAHPGRFHAESYPAFVLDVLAHTRQQVVVRQDGARDHTSKAMPQFCATHTARLTMEQLPAYAPDCNPIEPLGKKGKKEATHLQDCPECTPWQAEGDRALLHVAQTPQDITVLMARYCESLGAMAA